MEHKEFQKSCRDWILDGVRGLLMDEDEMRREGTEVERELKSRGD